MFVAFLFAVSTMVSVGAYDTGAVSFEDGLKYDGTKWTNSEGNIVRLIEGDNEEGN